MISANGVSVIDGGTTVQDFALTPRPTVTVNGTVTDATTGWPLYARIDISANGYNGTIFTNPVRVEYVSGNGFFCVEFLHAQSEIL